VADIARDVARLGRAAHPFDVWVRGITMPTLSMSIGAALAQSAPAACDDHAHGAEPFATFQLCFDEHATTESLPHDQAITICCLEHPIGGVTQVCGTTAAACEAYLSANLAATSATSAEVTAGCADYVTQRGQ
jgi:hypothetical protein